MLITQSTPAQLINSLKQTDDVVAWVNDTLNAVPDTEATPELTELEHQISALLASLDIAQEDLSSEIETTVDEVSRNVPRLTYDLQFMRNGAFSLQATVSRAVQSTKESVPDSTSRILIQLRELDTVKRHMELTRDALREAESWSTLELEVTSLLSENSYGKAAERLSEANRSVVVFQNTPEYELRRTLMVNLQNQLEASLSSALVAAINTRDINACRDYFSIFCQIQRESEFRNYYYASRRSTIVSAWNKTTLVDCQEASSETEGIQKFAGFLPSFYSEFLALLQTEQISVPSIFPDPAQSLSGLICSILSSLQPSFSQRLASLSEHYGSTVLEEFIAILKITEGFAASVRRLFQPFLESSSMQLSLTPSRPQGHTRRRSSRMSISLRPAALGSQNTASKKPLIEGVDWEEEVFQPFLYFQVDYGTWELQFLASSTQHLGKAEGQSMDSVAARTIKEGIAEMTRIAEGSLPRCNAFTYGYGFIGLVHALDSLFATYVDSWAIGTGVEWRSSQSSVTRGNPSLSDMDYSAQDWSDIQLYLHFLASARTVYDRIVDFDHRLHAELTQTTMRLRFPALPNPGEQHEILSRSPLNSAELIVLLDKTEGEIQSREANLLTPRVPTGQISPDPLLINARRAVFDFASSLQAALEHAILAPLRGHLTDYALSPSWSASGNPKSRTLDTELQIPVFSLSPTETMQRIGEGILNLPRLFEVYADDDALGFSLHTLPHVDQDWLKNPSEPILEPPSSPVAQTRRLSLLPAKSTPLDPEMVSSAWLSSLGHVLLEYLTGTVLPAIPTLTRAGAAQLFSDLDYLSNIASAINVHSSELDQWKLSVELTDEDAKERIANELDSADNTNALKLVARMRGWV